MAVHDRIDASLPARSAEVTVISTIAYNVDVPYYMSRSKEEYLGWFIVLAIFWGYIWWVCSPSAKRIRKALGAKEDD
jgi:hypothetical protein